VKRPALALTSLLALAAAACPPVEGNDAGPSLDPTLSAIHEELFMPRCGANACHGGPGPAAGLNLEIDPHANLVNVASDADPAIQRVTPGDPDASLLYLLLLGDSHNARKMPLNSQLEDYEIDAIKTWIEDGAEDN
jgi:hypothetical protein